MAELESIWKKMPSPELGSIQGICSERQRKTMKASGRAAGVRP
jgi:hypothetical protein